MKPVSRATVRRVLQIVLKGYVLPALFLLIGGLVRWVGALFYARNETIVSIAAQTLQYELRLAAVAGIVIVVVFLAVAVLWFVDICRRRFSK